MEELREYCDSVGVKIIKRSDWYIFVNSVDDGFAHGEVLFQVKNRYCDSVLIDHIKQRIGKYLLKSVFNTP